MRAGRGGPRQTATGISFSSCVRRRPCCRRSSWSASNSTRQRRCCSWRRSAPGWRRRCRGPTAPRARGPIRGENSHGLCCQILDLDTCTMRSRMTFALRLKSLYCYHCHGCGFQTFLLLCKSSIVVWSLLVLKLLHTHNTRWTYSVSFSHHCRHILLIVWT